MEMKLDFNILHSLTYKRILHINLLPEVPSAASSLNAVHLSVIKYFKHNGKSIYELNLLLIQFTDTVYRCLTPLLHEKGRKIRHNK